MYTKNWRVLSFACVLLLASATFAQDPFAIRESQKKANAVRISPKREQSSPKNDVKKSNDAPCQDALFLKSGKRIECEILGFSGSFGVKVRIGGKERTVPTSEIEKIELEVSDAFALGTDAFENAIRSGEVSEYRRAESLFQEARKSASRRLEKEQATAKLAETLAALGSSEEAADEFFLLCRLDPYSGYLESAPLRWAEPRVAAIRTSDFDERAKEWLKLTENPSGVENPTARLLAASYLLSSAKYKKEAIDALRDLVVLEAPDNSEPELAQTCKMISLLANAQLQRVNLIKKPTEREIERWEKTVDLLPSSMKNGAQYLVASGYKALGRDEDAARSFARVAVLATNDHVLAERATVDAADAFERLGDKTSADNLRKDAKERFEE